MPTKSGRQLNLNTYVANQLTIVANQAATNASTIFLKRLGFGVNEARILTSLGNAGPSTAQDLANDRFMHKSVISRAVRTLLDMELITENASNRPRVYELTARGHTVTDQVIDISLERQDVFLTGVTAAEVTIFLDILDRMHTNLQVVKRQLASDH